MFELKPLSNDAIPAALEKVERYRLLNEPFAAESICRDILAVDSSNQQALIHLVLCLADQFPQGISDRLNEAQDIATRLDSDYARSYYMGIISERCAKAQYRRGTPASGPLAYQWLEKAMEWYERAEALRPPGNDDALLRWNTCARLIMGNRDIQPPDQTASPLELE